MADFESRNWGRINPADIAGLTGKDIFERIVDGRLPGPSIAKNLRFRLADSDAAWAAFCRDYAADLDSPDANSIKALPELNSWIARGPVTLLYAVRDPIRNNAESLRLWLNK